VVEPEVYYVSARVLGIPLRGNRVEVIEFTDALSKSLPARCSVWSPSGWDLRFPVQIDDVCEINLCDEQDRSESENVALLTRAIETVDPDGRFVVAGHARGEWSRVNDRLFVRRRPTPERAVPAP
jgi:hypothetical protein